MQTFSSSHSCHCDLVQQHKRRKKRKRKWVVAELWLWRGRATRTRPVDGINSLSLPPYSLPQYNKYVRPTELDLLLVDTCARCVEEELTCPAFLSAPSTSSLTPRPISRPSPLPGSAAATVPLLLPQPSPAPLRHESLGRQVPTAQARRARLPPPAVLATVGPGALLLRLPRLPAVPDSNI